MKRIFRSGIIILLLTGMLFSLYSCHLFRLEDSYSEFYIENITDNSDDYFTSEEFDFARFQNVVFIPEIKAVNHEDYIIYICAYSKCEVERIKIKNVVLKEENIVLLNRELDKEIELKENAEFVYEGYIDGGTFTEKTLEVIDGKRFDLIIEVEIISDGECFSKNITFDILIKIYRSFVWPT